jgi:hypothetical protein
MLRIFFHILAALILSNGIVGCAADRVSSIPLYPANWPALVKGGACPDLTGTYRAVSDEVGLLQYPPGGEPRPMVFLLIVPVPGSGFGDPVPPLLVGRRILPWHIAGAFAENDPDEWQKLSQYTSALEAESARSGAALAAGWVRIQELSDGRLHITAGIDDCPVLNLDLRKEAQAWAFAQSHRYICKDGGLVVTGSFPPPREENPRGSDRAHAHFSFFRAEDGSLVMLEDVYAGSQAVLFKKWWRWRQIRRETTGK